MKILLVVVLVLAVCESQAKYLSRSAIHRAQIHSRGAAAGGSPPPTPPPTSPPNNGNAAGAGSNSGDDASSSADDGTGDQGTGKWYLKQILDMLSRGRGASGSRCKDHPDEDDRHAACDDPTQRQDCTAFVSECSKDCGVGRYTTTYRCGDMERTIFTCEEFCCCEKCTRGGSSPGARGTGSGVGCRNCERRKGPLNDKVCKSAGLCPLDTLYYPDKDLCLDEEIKDNNKMSWSDAQAYCTNEGGRVMTIHNQTDIDLRRNLLGYYAARGWTDLSFTDDINVISENLGGTRLTTVYSSLAAGLWNDNQPSGNGYCILAGRQSSSHKWDDANCGLSMDVVCEYQPAGYRHKRIH